MFFIFFSILPFLTYALNVKQDLGAASKDNLWIFSNLNKNFSGPANVPGGIYTDLKNAGVLTEEFYYRYNDEAYRWISKDDWFYNRTFTVSDDFQGKKQINLVFQGLDTVATVTLNGHELCGCNNMFRRYILPITQHINMDGENTLDIKFKSPVKYGVERNNIKLVSPFCVVSQFNGECHANQVRKMQASFSWDWGPAFPSMGIWKNVYLEAYDTLQIRDTAYVFNHSKENGQWNVNLTVHVSFPDTPISGKGDLVFELEVEQGKIVSTTLPLSYNSAAGAQSYNLQLTVKENEVQKWWPNGMGEQKLYKSKVEFRDENSAVSTKVDKIGFRTLRLVQDEVFSGEPNKGLSFYFEVNYVPMFAKGSNWIPAHVLPELGSSPEYVDNLLQSSKECNFNMLRVWGGGVYETDYFYQKCDELGILIWHDFMFACSMYPVDTEFLDTVREEVRDNVRRLQHHPSIALWAGNNENEAGLMSYWFGSPAVLKEDYVKLNVDTIRAVVLIEDPSRTFLISSPSNGIITEQQGFVADRPDSPIYGDTHYYNNAKDAWDPESYINTRFSSEFGFQSLPSLASLQAMTIPEDLALGIESEFMSKRQHHPGGNSELTSQVERKLLPPGTYTYNTLESLAKLVPMTQIHHAIATKTEAECHRRWRSKRIQSSGEGFTMGSLYWQLNDIWQAPSWASIEHSGKWKPLQYHAKNFYSNLLLSPYKQDDKLVLYVPNDLQHDQTGILEIHVHAWDKMSPVFESKANITITAGSADVVYNVTGNVTINDFLSNVGCKQNGKFANQTCFFMFRLVNDKNEELASSNFYLPTSIGETVGLKKPKVEVVTATENTSNLYPSRYVSVIDIKLHTDAIALFVWLDQGEEIKGRWSDNSFIMTETTRTVSFLALQPTTVLELLAHLKITSLLDYWF